MAETALRAWAEHFDGPPTVISTAPGRVNLIGEHVDYNDGLVLPAAIDRRVVVLARESETDDVRSAQIRESKDHRGPGWRRYAYACRAALEDRGLSAAPIQAMVSSSVPSGSGLSSSAALEVAFIGAWNHLGSHGMTPAEVAETAWQAENEYVGVHCGKMDQMASALGVENSGILIDMQSLRWDVVPLPPGVHLAILDTRQSRALAASKYNERVAECRGAVTFLSRNRPLHSLRDATLEDLAWARAAGMEETMLRRARHVVTEIERVRAFQKALAAGDLAALGEVCDASHRSLKDDYEVSSPRLDAMARSARSAPGCIATRMTGAGLGGCCVALIAAGSFEAFQKATRASYGMYGHPTPNIFAVKAAAGASAAAYG